MPGQEIAVSCRNVSKYFILPQSKSVSLKQAAVNIVKSNNVTMQKVLDGVSFDIYKGDFFGIVGRNGSGKSTLLKLIAGVYSPTGGEIDIRGGLTPFIELGVGFNPELSGRDNVYLNGALLGFTRHEMTAMYDDIVDFAELDQFMDQKLKNYSSGMQVRLAFSIAIKAKNDVLIFDEVLAVGDEAFQQKCIDVFDDYKAKHQTVILVTHDMETVKKYCNRAVLIAEGRVVEYGDPLRIASRYSLSNQSVINTTMDDVRDMNNEEIEAEAVVVDENGRADSSYCGGDRFGVDVQWGETTKLDHVVVNLFKKSGEHITAFRVKDDKVLKRKKFRALLDVTLNKGKYYFTVEFKMSNEKPLGQFYKTKEFMINAKSPNTPEYSGLIYVDHTIY